MNKLKILVTGSNGQLGRALQDVSQHYPQFEYFFLTREELPIQDADKIYACLHSLQPQFLVNCAAYTAVDRAESEIEQAFMINGDATGKLAEACNQFNTKFIHISTDYVFNGRATLPYKEDDLVDPVNTYGASKLKGEEQAVDKNDLSVIIRTSWVYSEYGNNFVKTMMRLMKDKAHLGVVNDQLGSPTYAADLATFILDVINAGEWKAGVYHYSNEGIISWFEFAEAIKHITGSTCIVKPITTQEFPTPAKRPAYSVFDKGKIKQQFNPSIPFWKTSLERCIQKLTS